MSRKALALRLGLSTSNELGLLEHVDARLTLIAWAGCFFGGGSCPESFIDVTLNLAVWSRSLTTHLELNEGPCFSAEPSGDEGDEITHGELRLEEEGYELLG